MAVLSRSNPNWTIYSGWQTLALKNNNLRQAEQRIHYTKWPRGAIQAANYCSCEVSQPDMRRKEQEGSHTARWVLSVARNDCSWYQLRVSHDAVRTSRDSQQYRSADKSLARPGRKQATFSAFCESWRFITTFTTVHHLSLP